MNTVTALLESLTAVLEYLDHFSSIQYSVLTPISYATGSIYGCPSTHGTHASYTPKTIEIIALHIFLIY